MRTDQPRINIRRVALIFVVGIIIASVGGDYVLDPGTPGRVTIPRPSVHGDGYTDL
jgi:hypothetical protein